MIAIDQIAAAVSPFIANHADRVKHPQELILASGGGVLTHVDAVPCARPFAASNNIARHIGRIRQAWGACRGQPAHVWVAAQLSM